MSLSESVNGHHIHTSKRTQDKQVLLCGQVTLYDLLILIRFCLFDLLDSPPTRTGQVSSVFFGGQDLSRDCSFLKPLASTPGNNKTLPIGEHCATAKSIHPCIHYIHSVLNVV